MKQYSVTFEWGRGIWRNIDHLESFIIENGGKIQRRPWGKYPILTYIYPGPVKKVSDHFVTGEIPVGVSLPEIY